MLLSKTVATYLTSHNLLLATAESCTAGLISSIIAQTPGSSAWLEAGFVVYSPEAKNKSLGVLFETIDKFNITSVEVAKEMALGALNNSRANMAIATTGVAGPSGGTDDIPVGTVCFAWSFISQGEFFTYTEKKHFFGDRNKIRTSAAKYALKRISYYHKKLNKI